MYLFQNNSCWCRKPRDTKDVKTASIPFNMGSVIKVNNVTGSPFINIGGNTTNIVELRNGRKAIAAEASGLQVGEARVYSFNASDAPYSGAATSFDLSLYDIQTFTVLKCSHLIFTCCRTKVRGPNSGAIGYAAKSEATGKKFVHHKQLDHL